MTILRQKSTGQTACSTATAKRGPVACWPAVVGIAGLMLLATGCGSSQPDIVFPDPDEIPRPSEEPGVVPDPIKFKRVPVN